jgi:hypothetical protein
MLGEPHGGADPIRDAHLAIRIGDMVLCRLRRDAEDDSDTKNRRMISSWKAR